MNFTQAVENYQKNPTKETLREQTEKLLQEMTLKERIYMLSGHMSSQMMKDQIKTGRNYNVHALPAGGCKRLGIPPVLFTDGPRGVVMGNSTCFPVSMLRASTFDRNLEYRFGKAVADEAIAQGANYYAGICINLVRSPRWGRCQETYGEDSYLLGEFGAALTKSVQEEGMIACPKHFALNSIEDLRFYIDVHTDDKTLHEVYLPHFKKCVDAGALSIMGAYNRFEEYYCCSSYKLLTEILRKEWGFDGFVMSDFVWGCRDTELCLRAGLDVEMMFSIQYTPGKIKKLIKKGNLNEEHVNRAVRNILGVLIRQIPKIKERSMQMVGCKEHRALAKEIAVKGMVLLKNNGILPLSADAGIILDGPYADTENIGDGGSSRVYDKQVVKPLEGIRQNFSNVSIRSQKGDTVILFVGSNRSQEGEYFASMKYSTEKKPANAGGDRASLRLSAAETELIHRYKKQGKHVIVVLYSGCAIITGDWKEDADAIIMNYYSGCEGAGALSDLLCGKENFSGRLPFTVAAREEDYPDIIGIGDKPYVIEYGYYHGYTLFDKEKKQVEYPFGFGLSYTSFDMDVREVSQNGKGVKVVVEVKNTGKRDSAEVVQVYVGSRSQEKERPVKLLKGFERVELQSGEKKTVEITIPKEELRFYDDGQWVMDDAYTVFVGNNCVDAMKRQHELYMEA